MARERLPAEIDFQLLRFLSADEIFERVTQSSSLERTWLLARLVELIRGGAAPAEYADALIERLLAIEAQTPIGLRSRLDSTLRQLALIATEETQLRLIPSLLQSTRKPRRQLGLRLAAANYQPHMAELILDCYERTLDEFALKTFTRTKASVSLVGVAESLLNHFGNNDYEQARIFERLVLTEPSYAAQIAARYPRGFVWGAGRARDASLLPTIRTLMSEHNDDFEFLSLAVWALGALGAREELHALRQRFSSDGCE